MSSAPRIPVSEPLLGPEELDAVERVVRSGWISSAGQELDAFESQWAAYCGRAHGVAVSSGTTALELAVEALDLEPGDEVILPTFTIISCALAVVRAGAVPVLVDADPQTWCMDVAQAAARVTPRTRAIMPVHIYGHPCEMDPLLALAEQHGLAVIEDAAEAQGGEYFSKRGDAAGWRRCGSFGDASAFSFYANKLITTGEGGMIVTDDPALAARVRSQRNLAFQPHRRFYHEDLGHQYRMTNLQAALALPQVARIDELLARKRLIAAAYADALRDVDVIQLPVERDWARSTYWMYGVVLLDHARLDAAQFAARLAEKHIETRPFFVGMHAQPALTERGLFQREEYPVADRLAQRGLYLPSGLTLTDAQIERVCNAVKEILS